MRSTFSDQSEGKDLVTCVESLSCDVFQPIRDEELYAGVQSGKRIVSQE